MSSDTHFRGLEITHSGSKCFGTLQRETALLVLGSAHQGKSPGKSPIFGTNATYQEHGKDS